MHARSRSIRRRGGGGRMSASTGLAMLASSIVGDDRSNLGGAASKEHRVTPDVFTLHLLGRLKVLVTIAETDESVSSALGRPFVSNDPGLLDGGIAGEGLEEGVVRHLAGQVSHEQAKMSRVPFEEGLIGPGLAAAGSNDGLRSCFGPSRGGCGARLGVDGGDGRRMGRRGRRGKIGSTS